MPRLQEPEQSGQQPEAEGNSPDRPARLVAGDRLLEGTRRHEHAGHSEGGDLEQVDRVTQLHPQVGSNTHQAQAYHRSGDRRHDDQPEPQAGHGCPEAAHRSGLVQQPSEQGPRAGRLEGARRVSHRERSSMPCTPGGRAP